jgi:hypothetical protein
MPSIFHRTFPRLSTRGPAAKLISTSSAILSRFAEIRDSTAAWSSQLLTPGDVASIRSLFARFHIPVDGPIPAMLHQRRRDQAFSLPPMRTLQWSVVSTGFKHAHCNEASDYRGKRDSDCEEHPAGSLPEFAKARHLSENVHNVRRTIRHILPRQPTRTGPTRNRA